MVCIFRDINLTREIPVLTFPSIPEGFMRTHPICKNTYPGIAGTIFDLPQIYKYSPPPAPTPTTQPSPIQSLTNNGRPQCQPSGALRPRRAAFRPWWSLDESLSNTLSIFNNGRYGRKMENFHFPAQCKTRYNGKNASAGNNWL